MESPMASIYPSYGYSPYPSPVTSYGYGSYHPQSFSSSPHFHPQPSTPIFPTRPPDPISLYYPDPMTTSFSQIYNQHPQSFPSYPGFQHAQPTQSVTSSFYYSNYTPSHLQPTIVSSSTVISSSFSHYQNQQAFSISKIQQPFHTDSHPVSTIHTNSLTTTPFPTLEKTQKEKKKKKQGLNHYAVARLLKVKHQQFQPKKLRFHHLKRLATSRKAIEIKRMLKLPTKPTHFLSDLGIPATTVTKIEAPPLEDKFMSSEDRLHVLVQRLSVLIDEKLGFLQTQLNHHQSIENSRHELLIINGTTKLLHDPDVTESNHDRLGRVHYRKHGIAGDGFLAEEDDGEDEIGVLEEPNNYIRFISNIEV